MKDKKIFSGDNSEVFWAEVGMLDGPLHSFAYSLGCKLQELESKIDGETWPAEEEEAESKPHKCLVCNGSGEYRTGSLSTTVGPVVKGCHGCDGKGWVTV